MVLLATKTRSLTSALAFLCLTSSLAPCEGTSSDPWEWSGVFYFPTAGHYIWTAARKATGSYQAAQMTMVMQVISPATKAARDAAAVSARTLWTTSLPSLTAGQEIEAGNRGYKLTMNSNTWVSQWEVHIDTPGYYGFYTDPAPTDFENGFHYLRTEAGADVEPVLTESDHDHSGTATQVADLAAKQAALCPAELHWEWAGVFDLSAGGMYTWSAARGTAGSYADATMKLIVYNLPGDSATQLEAAQTSAIPIWDGTATNKVNHDMLTRDSLMTLTFDEHSWFTNYYLNMGGTGQKVAIFAQHLPTEFENGFHYFKTSGGDDVEPTVQMACAPTAAPTPAPSTSTTHDDLWAAVIFGSFVTCLPTLLGVLFLFPEKAIAFQAILERLKGPINSFSSGAIFAAAAFLLMPEALHLAGSGHVEEVVGTWTWGTSILVGWFTCLCFIEAAKLMNLGGAVLSSGEAREARAAGGEAGPADADKGKATDSELATQEMDLKISRIIAPVLFGDFFHNFSDGLVIGVAMKVCGSSFGWKLIGVTVAHELPQEVADLCILVLNAKMRWWKATGLNFLCSLSTVIGAIITYSADVGNNEQGYILAYGAGVYLFVAITELGQSVAGDQNTKTGQGVALMACFIIGAVLIGLVLLDHEHCSAPVVAADGTVAAPAPSSGHHH